MTVMKFLLLLLLLLFFSRVLDFTNSDFVVVLLHPLLNLM